MHEYIMVAFADLHVIESLDGGLCSPSAPPLYLLLFY